MNPDKIFDIRFTAPVGIMIFVIFLFSPTGFVCMARYLSAINWIASIVGILGVGFMISSISEFFIRTICKLHISNKYDYNYKHELFKYENASKKIKDPDNARELSDWIILYSRQRDEGRDIPSQIHKRWNIALANFNAFFGVLFGTIIESIFLINGKLPINNDYPIIFPYIISSIFLLLFIKNGCEAIKSVRDIHHLLAEKSATIIKNENN